MNGLQQTVSSEDRGRVSPYAERFPVMSYDTGELRYISKREKVLIDAWIATNGNYGECKRLLEEAGWRGGKKPIASRTIVLFLQRPQIVKYIVEKQKERALAEGYDEVRWKAEGIRYKNGDLKTNGMTFFYWKELGRALGFYKQADNNAPMFNQQINFVQADGNE